jgi:CHAD domain-containing protein
MSAIEQEILQRIRNLPPEHQRRVLDFVTRLEEERPLSARELMQLPAEERQRRVQAAIASAAEEFHRDEDFETFEAYTEEPPP